jgi:Tol biopolymer transport system component
VLYFLLTARPPHAGTTLNEVFNRDGNYDIYVVNADGSNPVNAMSHPSRDDHAAWHPDGRRLLFVSDRDGGSDLYLGVAPDEPPKNGPP